MYHGQPDVRREIFLNTGAACDLLVDAFSKLPNLRSVGLRDYDGNGRLRDGERAKWRSYGWSLGSDPRERSPHRYAPPDSMLPILLFALGKASVRPTNLEAFLRKKKMPDRSFDLSCLQLDVSPVLSGLRTLLLSLDDARNYIGGYVSVSNMHTHLKNFLHHTPLLEHLRLNFTNMPVTPSSDVGSESLLRWIGAPFGAATKTGPPPIAFDHLTTLDLGMLAVIPKTLLQVVSKCPKLESLSLWKVTLSCSEDRSEENRSLWSVYLPQIGNAFQAPESVSRVMIGFAVEEYRGARSDGSSDAKFANKVSIDGNGEKVFEDPEGKASYRKRVGSNAKDWLEDLGKRTFIEKPDLSDYSDDSENDDDGEDAEDDGGESLEDDDGGSDGDGGGEAQVIVLD
jgi:hypothetical protein